MNPLYTIAIIIKIKDDKRKNGGIGFLVMTKNISIYNWLLSFDSGFQLSLELMYPFLTIVL
jgi:hypothetical protein